MPRAVVNGVELFYEQRGTGDPVLFHHGYTGSRDNWQRAVELLSPSYRCTIIDCRGAGDSGRPASGHTIEQYAADTLALADALGLERFTFVGHSMGGVVGMELGINHASRLEKLVLVAPAPADGVQVLPGVRERSLALRAARDRETLLRERKALSARYRPDEAHARAVDRALSVSDAHYVESWEALEASRRGDRLARVTTPTLVMAGAADGLLPANLKDFQRLPNATLHVFSRVSHGIPYEAPEEFAAALSDFLQHGVVTAASLQAKLQAEAAAAR